MHSRKWLLMTRTLGNGLATKMEKDTLCIYYKNLMASTCWQNLLKNYSQISTWSADDIAMKIYRDIFPLEYFQELFIHWLLCTYLVIQYLSSMTKMIMFSMNKTFFHHIQINPNPRQIPRSGKRLHTSCTIIILSSISIHQYVACCCVCLCIHSIDNKATTILPDDDDDDNVDATTNKRQKRSFIPYQSLLQSESHFTHYYWQQCTCYVATYNLYRVIIIFLFSPFFLCPSSSCSISKLQTTEYTSFSQKRKKSYFREAFPIDMHIIII